MDFVYRKATISDSERIAELFKEMLRTIYHSIGQGTVSPAALGCRSVGSVLRSRVSSFYRRIFEGLGKD